MALNLAQQRQRLSGNGRLKTPSWQEGSKNRQNHSISNNIELKSSVQIRSHSKNKQELIVC